MNGSMFDDSALPLLDDNVDLLGDFEEDAMLDLLGTLEPLNPASLQHSVANPAAQTSSGEGSAEDQIFAQEQQQADRKAVVKELNKRAQKRHREKQKTKWQRLQEELAASTAAVQKLQSENQALTGRNSMLEQVASLRDTSQLYASLPQQVSLRPSYANSLAHSVWRNRGTVTCTVHHTKEVISLYQVARWGPHQMANLWQEYVRELAICLATGGEALMWDLTSKPGRRLAALHDELCSLCAAKATADLESHHAFVRRRILPAGETEDADTGADADVKPDWLELAQCLNLSNDQLEKLFLLRRAYLQKSAVISGQQHDLQHQLQNSTGHANALQHGQIAHQIQDNKAQLQEAFMQYLGLIVDGVFSVWQTSTAIVRTFPHPPEVLMTMVDALALQADEPTAASFDAAAAASNVVQEMADPWPSLENHIYKHSLKEKLASMPMQPRTAVAG